MPGHWTANTSISAPLPRDDLHHMAKAEMEGLAFTPVGMVFDYTQVDYEEIFLAYDPALDPDREMVGHLDESEMSAPSATTAPIIYSPAPEPIVPVPPARFADIVALGRYIESAYPPAVCSEHVAFGGVAPVHPVGSPHYMERAIDVNADHDEDGVAVPEGDLLDRIDAFARAHGFTTLWRTAGHYDHLHIVDWR